jgi:hypothetical protein
VRYLWGRNYQHVSRCVTTKGSRWTSPPRPGPDTRANTEPTWVQNGHMKNYLKQHNPRSECVRRQGLEPRTRRLRVCCSVRLTAATSCDFTAVPAQIHDSQSSPGTACYRLLPGWNATSEQTWSKHSVWIGGTGWPEGWSRSVIPSGDPGRRIWDGASPRWWVRSRPRDVDEPSDHDP